MTYLPTAANRSMVRTKIRTLYPGAVILRIHVTQGPALAGLRSHHLTITALNNRYIPIPSYMNEAPAKALEILMQAYPSRQFTRRVHYNLTTGMFTTE